MFLLYVVCQESNKTGTAESEIGGNKVVKEENEEYSVQTSFACFRTFQSSSPEIFCTGKYLDRIAEGQKGLQFRERIVVCDSERIDTLLVIPL